MKNCKICGRETKGSYLEIPICFSAYLHEGIVDVHSGFDNSSYQMTLLGTFEDREIYRKTGYMCKISRPESLLPVEDGVTKNIYEDDFCPEHKPKHKTMSYLYHSIWMEEMDKAGNEQEQCHKCGRWLFECEK